MTVTVFFAVSCFFIVLLTAFKSLAMTCDFVLLENSLTSNAYFLICSSSFTDDSTFFD